MLDLTPAARVYLMAELAARSLDWDQNATVTEICNKAEVDQAVTLRYGYTYELGRRTTAGDVDSIAFASHHFVEMQGA